MFLRKKYDEVQPTYSATHPTRLIPYKIRYYFGQKNAKSIDPTFSQHSKKRRVTVTDTFSITFLFIFIWRKGPAAFLKNYKSDRNFAITFIIIIF